MRPCSALRATRRHQMTGRVKLSWQARLRPYKAIQALSRDVRNLKVMVDKGETALDTYRSMTASQRAQLQLRKVYGDQDRSTKARLTLRAKALEEGLRAETEGKECMGDALTEMTRQFVEEVQAGNDLAAENSELRQRVG